MLMSDKNVILKAETNRTIEGQMMGFMFVSQEFSFFIVKTCLTNVSFLSIVKTLYDQNCRLYGACLTI